MLKSHDMIPLGRACVSASLLPKSTKLEIGTAVDPVGLFGLIWKGMDAVLNHSKGCVAVQICPPRY